MAGNGGQFLNNSAERFGILEDRVTGHAFGDCAHLGGYGEPGNLVDRTKEANKASDSRHPYGYGRAAFFWALVGALGLFGQVLE